MNLEKGFGNEKSIEALKNEFFTKQKEWLQFKGEFELRTKELEEFRQKLEAAGIDVNAYLKENFGQETIAVPSNNELESKKADIEKRRQKDLSIVQMDRVPLVYSFARHGSGNSELGDEEWSELDDYLLNKAPDNFGDINAVYQMMDEMYNGIVLSRSFGIDTKQVPDKRAFKYGPDGSLSSLAINALQWYLREKKQGNLTISLKDYVQGTHEVINAKYDAELAQLEHKDS